jgi:proteasome accessory factor B
MRMFERDKDELRAFGIPIETVTNDEGETIGYKLSSRDFYLPYLALAQSGRALSKPRRVDKYGYQALSTLTFEPDELAALASAIARVSELGDPALKLDAESVRRKLAFDLPDDLLQPDDQTTRISPRAQPDAEILEQLNDALLRRKRVTFLYNAIAGNSVAERSAEPYGLFFLSSHWYLAGRDIEKNELRNFRVSRIERVRVNTRRSQSADYTIPADFNLREHARSRQPWELGDGDLIEALVRFPRRTGTSFSAARLGEPVPGEQGLRRFRIRREDAFARWLLSFGGDAIPVSPPALVDEFRQELEATQSLYDGNGNAR